jgi:hypothetical protein
MVKKILKKCEFCEKEYWVYKNRENTSRFCSKKCYNNSQLTKLNVQRKRKKINCLFCNKEIEIHNYEKHKYCSIKCFAIHQNIINPKKDNRIIKKCICCDKNYKVFKYRSESSKFCSVKCHDEYRENHIMCPSCNNVFKSPKYENRKYCSESCSCKGVKKRKSLFSEEIKEFVKKYYQIEDEYPIKNKNFKYWVDIKINSKIIECYGDYWHCNPLKYNENYYHTKIRKTAKEIWDYDNRRESNIKSLNYNFIYIWEYDWNNNKEIIMAAILKFLRDEI